MEKKKVKYIQKTLFLELKQAQNCLEKQQNSYQEKIQHGQIQKKEKSILTTVINVKVQHLRKLNYNNLVEWLKDDNHLYIGRHNHYVAGATGSIWANPFKVNQYGREGCIQKYKQYVMSNEKLMEGVKNLKGKVLGCWCAPQACHGDVLAELANQFK